MSDVEDNVIAAPTEDSQASTSSSQKREREDDGTDTESEGGLMDSQMSEKSMDGHLVCSVCLSVMSNPFTIIPCMHTFDRSCLREWWISHGNCPMCKQRSQSAKHAFQLSNIINHYHKERAKKKQAVDPDELSHEEIYPFGRPPRHVPLPPGSSVAGSQGPLLFLDDEDEDEDEDEGSEDTGSVLGPLEEPFPGGHLFWPCPSCDPNNQTGYTCPNPIPTPSAQQIADEQQARGLGDLPIRAPARGERRLNIATAQGLGIVGADDHLSCSGCNCLLPKGWTSSVIKCGECETPYCTNYDPQGCPDGPGLRPRNRLSIANMDPSTLWNYTPDQLRYNIHERTVFTDYLRNQLNITVDQVLEQIAGLKMNEELEQLRDELGDDEDMDPNDARLLAPERRWGPEAWLCENGIYYLISDKFFAWWKAERAKNLVPANVRSLPDCWYGWECRTQGHRPGHAAGYNHICENTAAARGRR